MDMIQPYQAFVADIFFRLKAGETEPLGGPALPVTSGAKAVAKLVPVTAEALVRPREISHLARWRQENQHGFPEKFTVTEEGTKRWLAKALLENPDRLLFWLKTPDGAHVGHLGLFRFDYARRHCEADNIVRGRRDLLPGVMTLALAALMDWTFATLDVAEIFLKVLSENERAIRLYDRTGFAEVGRIPLYRQQLEDASLRWVEAPQTVGQASDRSYTVMRHGRPARFGPLRYPEKNVRR